MIILIQGHSYFHLQVQNLFVPCSTSFLSFIVATWNFLCAVKTGKECFPLCKKMGCYERSFQSMIASTNDIDHHHYRYGWVMWICAYTPNDPEYRPYKEWISVQKCHRTMTLAVHIEDFVLLDVKLGSPCEKKLNAPMLHRPPNIFFSDAIPYFIIRCCCLHFNASPLPI